MKKGDFGYVSKLSHLEHLEYESTFQKEFFYAINIFENIPANTTLKSVALDIETFPSMDYAASLISNFSTIKQLDLSFVASLKLLGFFPNLHFQLEKLSIKIS